MCKGSGNYMMYTYSCPMPIDVKVNKKNATHLLVFATMTFVLLLKKYVIFYLPLHTS